MSENKLFAEHTVKAYDHEISQLESMVYEMSKKSLEQIKKLQSTLNDNDHDLAHKIVEGDCEINELNAIIEEKVVQIVALRQPLADDLRNILHAIKISADLERMGDHIKNVARLCINHDFNVKKYESLMTDVYLMIDILIGMLQTVVTFNKNNLDIDELHDVCRHDQMVDDKFNLIFSKLVEFMNAKNGDKESISICTSMIFVIKNLERVGDLIVSIAQAFYYVLTSRRIIL